MGLYGGGAAVDIAGISARMQPVVEAWQSGIVQIVDPNIADGVFDPWGNDDTGGEPSVLWQGSARIQPIKNPVNTQGAFEQQSLRGVRFQIPLSAHLPGDFPVREGLQVYVVDGGMFPELEQYAYIVASGINSTLAWNRTIVATVDMGAVVDAPVAVP